MWFKRIASVLCIPMLFMLSCSKNRDEILVAKIKDRTISLSTYENTFVSVDPKFLPETQDLAGLTEFLETMIDRELMALKADELGYDKDEYVVEGMKAFKQVGLQAGYLKIKVADKLEPTEKELKEYYNVNDIGEATEMSKELKEQLTKLDEEMNKKYNAFVEKYGEDLRFY